MPAPTLTTDLSKIKVEPVKEFPAAKGRTPAVNPTAGLIAEAAKQLDTGYAIVVNEADAAAIRSLMQRAGRHLGKSVHVRISDPKDGKVKVAYKVTDKIDRPATSATAV